MRIVRHRRAGTSRAGGHNDVNTRAPANADEAALPAANADEAALPAANAEEAALPVANAEEAAPMERQEAPSQPDILIVEHPVQQPAEAPSRTVQISMDAMHLFLSVYAMQLRALRRRGGITRVDMNVTVDACPEVVFCSIVITGESEDSVRRVAEDIEDSGWSDYQPIERDVFEQSRISFTFACGCPRSLQKLGRNCEPDGVWLHGLKHIDNIMH